MSRTPFNNGLVLFLASFNFLSLKFYSFSIFYFPTYIFLFNWLLSKIESASSTHTMGWLLAFGPLGSTGQRKIGSHPARHIKLLRKRKRILYEFCKYIHLINRVYFYWSCPKSFKFFLFSFFLLSSVVCIHKLWTLLSGRKLQCGMVVKRLFSFSSPIFSTIWFQVVTAV